MTFSLCNTLDLCHESLKAHIAVEKCLNMDLASLPKIELHLHLDCSLTYEVVNKIDPSIDREEYEHTFIMPEKCSDLNEYLEVANQCLKLMQSKEELRLVTLDLFDQLRADNVIYSEIRFAPHLHLDRGLNEDDVVQAVNDAVEEGIKETGLEVRIILCTLRHYSEEESMRTVKLVEKFRGTNVVGFDIASDEAGHPITNHVKAFQYAKSKSIPCTAHAGEAKGADSVWETLEHFHVSRVGHGVRSIEDESLLKYLIEENIHLEICPTSNVRTNVVDSIEDHPIDKIYRSGVSLSINTDARSIMKISLEDEYKLLTKTFNWGKAHFLKCNLESIKHSFASEELKSILWKKIVDGFSK